MVESDTLMGNVSGGREPDRKAKRGSRVKSAGLGRLTVGRTTRSRGRMETHEIRYFLAMVRELNFTRAATVSGITQPALTRAIKKLETELGGALFLRRPGRIELTRLAREVLPQLEAIEQSMASVRAQAASVADALTSTLRLGVMCTVGPMEVVSMLEKVQAEVPDLEVLVIDAKADEIVNLIASDEIDVGISAWPSYPETVAAQCLTTERYVLVMRDDHALAKEVVVPLDRLAGLSYIERLGCEFDDYYEARHGKWTIDLDIVFSSNREDWVQGMLVAGLGCAIIPEMMQMPPGLVKRPLTMPEVSREISLLTVRGKPLPRASGALVRVARKHKWRAQTA